MIQRPAHQQHRADEAQRSPQPHMAVAVRLVAERAQGDHLELGQHRVPEETEGGQQDRHAPHLVDPEHRQERQRGGQVAETDDAQPGPGAVGQPAPQVGRADLGDLRHRHQHADGERAEAQVFQVQRPVRHQGAEQAEVEEIEPGQAPVKRHTAPLAQNPPGIGANGGVTSPFWLRWRR